MPRLRPIEVPNRDRLYQQGGESALEFLELGVPLGISIWDDDFQGDQMRYDATAPGAYQSTASGTGAATAAINTGAVNGELLLDTGTDDDGRSDLSLGRHFRGDRFAVCCWRFDLRDAVTSVKMELGFTDVVSGTDAGAVNSKGGNTWTASDAVVLCYDTDDDALLTLMGVQNGTAATVADFSTTLSAATFYYGIVVLRGALAAGYLLNADGRVLERQPNSGYMSAAVTSTVLLTPWAFAQNRSASQRRLYLDRLKVYQFTTADS